MSSSRRSSKQSDASGELIYECKAAFLSIYDDINDKIESKKRLSNVLQQSGRNPTRTSMDKYWPRNTEELSFNDFVDICRKEPVTSADDLMKAFKKIDINGDGYISLDELYKIMNAHGEMMSREEVRKMIDEVDENKDGKLDYQEYTNMIMKTAEESKKFSRKVMEKKERKKKRGEKLHNSASNTDSEKLSGQTKSLDHNNENLRENIADKFEGSVHDKPKSDEHVGNLSEDLKKRETRSDSELRGFGSETQGDNNFGSVTSLRSTRQRDRLLGSVTSLRSDSKKNNAGSQVSVRTLQDEQTGSKVALRSSDDTGSKVSLGSKTGVTDSQISLKHSQGSRSSLRPVQKESMGSKSSLTSYKEKEKTTDVKDENGLGSQASLRSDDVPRPSPRVKGGIKGKSPSTKGRDKLPDPKSLQDWMYYTSKGCFFYEEDEIVSHVYSLKLTQDSTVYLSAYPIQEPASLNLAGAEPVDTALFIFDSRGKFVTCTEHRDTKGTYGVKCDLSAGEYQVLPYTTGCRFKQRSEDSQENMKESKLVKVKDDKVSITSAFRTALEEIFDLCDLDNNGLMSRDEFNWFNLRTSGEELGEDEWEVVEEKTKLSHGEITKQGFIELNEMEAEDAQGDVEDLWITLTSMGMNKGLIMDEACPYRVDVYVEESGRKKPSFRVTGIESLEKKEFVSEICHFTIEKADEPTKVRNMKDLYMYTYRNEYRATIVIDNRSRSSVNLQANCSRSKNVVSNRPALDHTVEVEPQSMAIAHHLLPKSELSDWTVACTENILK